MSELKTIAEQVSLLNRLLELLMMQEDDSLQEDFVFNLGWVLILPGKGPEIGSYKYCPGISKENIVCEEAWNHPITQKAWSVELVKVAKALSVSDLYKASDKVSNLKGLLTDICNVLYPRQDRSSFELESILNKYRRSLSD